MTEARGPTGIPLCQQFDWIGNVQKASQPEIFFYIRTDDTRTVCARTS